MECRQSVFYSGFVGTDRFTKIAAPGSGSGGGQAVQRTDLLPAA